jgi:inner membrane protein YidH
MTDEASGEIPLPIASRFDVQPTVGNHFSWFNTRLSVERTYLSWIRTGISLIGFGFTIVQFFQRLQGMSPEHSDKHPGAPRDLGVALIATGIGAVVVASVQYRRGIHYLWSPQFLSIAGIEDRPRWTPAGLSAYVLIFIGLAALVSVFVNFP